jgi:protein O-mannosyl-transferase
MRPPRDSITSVSALAGMRAAAICAPLLLIVAIIAAYANTLRVPFVFDDAASIVGNPSIRDLSRAGQLLSPPTAEGTTVGGRPLLNLSFAINYAISREAVWSYHALNLVIHLGCALLLFGIVRRTLERVPEGGPDSTRPSPLVTSATPVAVTAAALWALHPLQTEAVTYLSQRAESLASFGYLLTLYAFIRAQATPSSACWLIASVIACVLGGATKEITATAPLLVLLYDAAFVSGTWRAAWRSRPIYYCALFATWLLIAALLTTSGGRGGTAGLDTGVSPWRYALTQGEAILHYLRLALWPFPQVFDYGTPLASNDASTWLSAGFVVLLLVTAIAIAARSKTRGFLGVAFFVLLAPSSSFVPIATQTIAEHRMYLPLAAVVLLVTVTAFRRVGRLSLVLLTGVAAAGGIATWQRNNVYSSDLTLWADTVAHAPNNPRAHSNLGNALLAGGQATEAIAEYQSALALQPDYADAENNLGHALLQNGQAIDALPHLERAARAKPNSVEVLTNLGRALVQTGRTTEAITRYRRALTLNPNAAGARYNLANAEFKLGDYAAATQSYERVLQADAKNCDARFNLAATLLRLNRPDDAIAQYERLLELSPNDAMAHAELANVLAHVGHRAEAIAHFEAALRLQPDLTVARRELQRLRTDGPSTPP